MTTAATVVVATSKPLVFGVEACVGVCASVGADVGSGVEVGIGICAVLVVVYCSSADIDDGMRIRVCADA
eukprot:6579075-Alexandrium_andersonii.AAC.1